MADLRGGDVMDMPETQWARTVDGASIAYQDIGEGPVTLVFIAGWLSHLEVYWEQPRYVRFVERLSRNLRLLLFDKRGVGMSDRLAGAPDLGVLLDDVRAVMDAAGVERAALLASGYPAPELAAFFAATYPERTLCLVLGASLLYGRREIDYPWGQTEKELEEEVTALSSIWGRERRVSDYIPRVFGDGPEDWPRGDAQFLRWVAKHARYSATPTSYEAFERMWFQTDLRSILPTIHVPTGIFFRKGTQDERERHLLEFSLRAIPGAQRVDVDATDAVIWLSHHEAVVSAVEHFLATVAEEEAALDRMLATVLFTDIVGSTEKACEVGDACWNELLERQAQVTRAMLARYRGREIKTTGDGFLATFDGPARAVKCAEAICEAVRPLGLEVRAGCHTGEIELLGEDVGGIAVHIAARVAALAGPSEVLVSSTVKDLVAGSGLTFLERGERRLKGVPEPWRIYALSEP